MSNTTMMSILSELLNRINIISFKTCLKRDPGNYANSKMIWNANGQELTKTEQQKKP